jgi:hypothetical protein
VIAVSDEARDYRAAVDWVTTARDEFGLPPDEHDVDDAFLPCRDRWRLAL